MGRFAGVMGAVSALALLLAACGGGGGAEPADTSEPPPADASSEAPAGDPASETAEVPSPAATVPGAGGEEELPLFLSDFTRVCDTQVGFSGAAAYNGEPGTHPVQLFESYGVDATLLETSRDLPKGWAIEQDLDFEDNSELAAIELIACSVRGNEKPNGTKCEFDSDGKTVTLELVDATYELTVYEAVTGEVVGTKKLEAKTTECPFAVSFEEGQTEEFNEPEDKAMINALKEFVVVK